MTSELHRAKQPVSSVLAGPYGHPLHPVLVTVPIGSWVASLVFDIAATLGGDQVVLAKGSIWLIAIGLAGALVAATVGFLDLTALPAGTSVFRTGIAHMSINLVVTALYAVNLYWRLPGYDGVADAVPIGPLVLSAVSVALLAVGGYLGGKLAFRYGVRVADEARQATGYRR